MILSQSEITFPGLIGHLHITFLCVVIILYYINLSHVFHGPTRLWIQLGQRQNQAFTPKQSFSR